MPTNRVIRPAVSADNIVPFDRLSGDPLRRQAAAQPDAIAWVTASRTWTYAQADAAANRIANGLAALGLERGDRAACLTRHGAECTLLMIAASRIGAVCAPLHWRLAGPEVKYVVDHDPNGPRAHLLRSAGQPSPGVEMRIVDPATGEGCADDAVREVWVRSSGRCAEGESR